MHPTACDNVPLRTHAAHEDSNGGRPATWPVTVARARRTRGDPRARGPARPGGSGDGRLILVI